MSSIKRYKENDDQITQVQELYKRQDLSEDGRCNLSFALAKMYEDLGDLNQAFIHLSKGNATRKKLLNYSIKKDKRLFNSLKKTQPYLLKSSLQIKKGSNVLSPVFIVGMPRSGTTLVEQIISSHSEIIGAGELKYVVQYGGKLAINSTSVNTVAVSDFRKKYLSMVGEFCFKTFGKSRCVVVEMFNVMKFMEFAPNWVHAAFDWLILPGKMKNSLAQDYF